MTKSEIRTFALSQFSRYGLESVSMDDIAHELKISKKTLYEHFSSKEQLVFEILDCCREDWEANSLTIKRNGENPIRKVFSFYLLHYAFIKKVSPDFINRSGKRYKDISRLIKQGRFFFRDTMQAFLTAARKKGLLRKGLNIQTFLETEIILFDHFITQILPHDPRSFELYQYFAFPRILGIINPDKYDPEPDLSNLQENFDKVD